MNVAIIPARGGSKRIPRKNVRNFCGRPAISWVIEAALKAKSIDMLFVSTDDSEIEEIALEPRSKKFQHLRVRPPGNDAPT